MTEDVTLEVFDGNGNQCTISTSKVTGTSYTLSVMTFVNSKLSKSTTDEAMKKLLTALVTYGGYAQTYFAPQNSKIDTSYLAYEVLADYGIAVPDLSGITADSIDQSFIKGDTSIGITLKSADVALDSAVNMTMKFALDEGCSIEDYSFELTYTENYVEKTKVLKATYDAASGRYSVIIPDIAAAYWDYMYKVTVTSTETAETYECYGSVLAYIKLKLKNSSSSEALLNMCKAMYNYNQAANEFFNK